MRDTSFIVEGTTYAYSHIVSMHCHALSTLNCLVAAHTNYLLMGCFLMEDLEWRRKIYGVRICDLAGDKSCMTFA
jgi:hypothetical protein